MAACQSIRGHRARSSCPLTTVGNQSLALSLSPPIFPPGIPALPYWLRLDELGMFLYLQPSRMLRASLSKKFFYFIQTLRVQLFPLNWNGKNGRFNFRESLTLLRFCNHLAYKGNHRWGNHVSLEGHCLPNTGRYLTKLSFSLTRCQTLSSKAY